MDRSFLVGLIGFPATLIHGDTLVWDRWRWLRARLPTIVTGKSHRLLDVGCGSGAFSIGAALRGYEALGVSWDERNQSVAEHRAALCRAHTARFDVFDVRHLERHSNLEGEFDVVICLENIEHILDDRKLMIDMARCLRPGGRLLLTTPNIDYHPITREDEGPFSMIEDGGHVRRGYSETQLVDLCQASGLTVEKFSSCSGFLSQKVTMIYRFVSRLHPLAGWLIILPMRLLPPLLDRGIARLTCWPDFSICLEARRPERAERV